MLCDSKPLHLLPGLVLVGLLIAMKLARGDAWRLRWKTIPLMAFESVVWAIPLLVIAAAISHLVD